MIIQIECGPNGLYGLDNVGNIWYRDHGSSSNGSWRQIPSPPSGQDKVYSLSALNGNEVSKG